MSMLPRIATVSASSVPGSTTGMVDTLTKDGVRSLRRSGTSLPSLWM